MRTPKEGMCTCRHGAGFHDVVDPGPCLYHECQCPGFTAEAPKLDIPAAPIKQRGALDVINFWSEVAGADCDSVIEKLAKYGSLDSHAYQMLTLVGRPHASLREGTEIAIASYVAGKLNRIMESLSLGILPTEDCWDDLARYAMMARYVRKFGRWP